MKYLVRYRGPMEADIPGEFGWSPGFWCPRCKGLEMEPDTVEVSGRTDTDPEEMAFECPLCLSHDVVESEGRLPLKATKRRTIHNPRLAA